VIRICQSFFSTSDRKTGFFTPARGLGSSSLTCCDKRSFILTKALPVSGTTQQAARGEALPVRLFASLNPCRKSKFSINQPQVQHTSLLNSPAEEEKPFCAASNLNTPIANLNLVDLDLVNRAVRRIRWNVVTVDVATEFPES